MTPAPRAEFDAHAAGYDAELQAGLRLTGEGKEYYARARIARVEQHLARLGVTPARVLDFGCGDGDATPELMALAGVREFTGLDVSVELLARARARHAAPGRRFVTPAEAPADGRVDLAFTNGVFHHIPPADRSAAAADVHARLRPGGIFAFWENNPWNPGTRLVMSRIPFDRAAMPFGPPTGRKLLRDAGFEVLAVESWFWFPRALAILRPLEPLLRSIPLGGQYLVLARRP